MISSLHKTNRVTNKTRSRLSELPLMNILCQFNTTAKTRNPGIMLHYARAPSTCSSPYVTFKKTHTRTPALLF